MARFFIHRPVFAWVLAIIVMLAGALGLETLPISQYPEVAPPTVRIRATYSGASAEAVQNSVTTVIEDGMTGIDNLLYMTSTSSTGSSSISLVFAKGTDPDIAQVQVQNKLQLVESQLPDRVIDQGVSVTRSNDSILMVGALVSEDGKYSTTDLADLIHTSIESPVQRLEGVGSINTFGSPHAMRIWLNPESLVQYQLTPDDITSAIEAQNTNVTVGTLGDLPAIKGQQLTVEMKAQSQLRTVDDFRNILLKTDSDGAAVYLADVARVELGTEDYASSSRYNGHPAAGFGINLATGANAVQTSERVRALLDNMGSILPEGVKIEYPYDTTPFVEASIEKVEHTLFEAIGLVFVVMLVFLQNWRATLIPTIAVPVVLLGTFGVLSVFGYSINTLTMFGMVLAIGLLVDDAIVVVENVERVMEEEGLGPVEATEKSMSQISSALIGIGLVLSAVFLPMAFLGGSTGVIYRQFSVTIVTAMTLSVLVALILTPALCATMLKRRHGPGPAPARWFNRNFDRMADGYLGINRLLLRRAFSAMAGLAVVLVLAGLMYTRIPSSFLPQEDQGALMTIMTLPEGSTRAQTEAAVEKLENFMLAQDDAVVSTFGAIGFSFGGSGQNRAMLFTKLKDFDERQGKPELSASALAAKANGYLFQNNREGTAFVLQPPAIPGMGSTSGFSMYLVDSGSQGHDALMSAANELVAKANADPRVTGMRGTENLTQTSMRLDIDQHKATSFGVSISDINSMLATIFAGTDVNQFQMGNELREVYVQGDAPWRMQPDDVYEWYARNSDGEMVPFSAFTTLGWETVPSSLNRYGGVGALELQGQPTTGTSSGDAMDAMVELTSELPGNYSVAWTGLSYQEQLSGNQAPFLYAVSVLFVFLCLAALYESWSIPLSVMLAVPVGILGALAAALFFGQSNDVYFKVGLLTTVGLAAKNAILIVEFAVEQQTHGKSLVEATLIAARQRLRPILMTSFAFILGVVPLATASGAGAGAQNAIGIGVLGGMVAATGLGVFFVPALFVCVRRIFDRRKKSGPEVTEKTA